VLVGLVQQAKKHSWLSFELVLNWFHHRWWWSVVVGRFSL